MQYFTIQAHTHREAIDKMKLQYGENGKILTYRNIRLGGFLGMFSHEGVEVTGYIAENNSKKINITGYIAENNSKKINIQDEKLKILESAKKEQTLNYILKELKELKYDIGKTVAPIKKYPPAVEQIKELLYENDFSHEYTKQLCEKMLNDFSVIELENVGKMKGTVVEWIAEGIQIYEHRPQAEKQPTIITVVGPTGVGKTTTVAKLAALFGVAGNGKKPLSVRIITIDNYRIGAKQQIETYGDIMRIPVSFAETPSDLKKLIALYNDVDLILVDTIGKSQ
ncbi:MAG: flagellar biosynthesis protein FlhF, partial [Spirochaetia bacterium]